MNTEEDVAPRWFREIVWGSVAAGLCPPVPFPFLEDWGRNFIRRKFVARILISAGLKPSKSQIRILAGEHDSGCFWQILMLPLRWLRLLRVLYWLIFVNRLIRPLSDVFVEMYLLGYAVRSGIINQDQLNRGNSEALRLRQCIEQARKRADMHPFLAAFRQIFQNSAKLLADFSRYLGRKIWNMRKAAGPSDISEEEIRRVFPRGEDLIRLLWSDRSSLEKLENTLSEIVRNRG